MAPVSIKALAVTLTPQALAHGLSYVHGSGRVTAGY